MASIDDVAYWTHVQIAAFTHLPAAVIAHEVVRKVCHYLQPPQVVFLVAQAIECGAPDYSNYLESQVKLVWKANFATLVLNLPTTFEDAPEAFSRELRDETQRAELERNTATLRSEPWFAPRVLLQAGLVPMPHVLVRPELAPWTYISVALSQAEALHGLASGEGSIVDRRAWIRLLALLPLRTALQACRDAESFLDDFNVALGESITNLVPEYHDLVRDRLREIFERNQQVHETGLGGSDLRSPRI